MDLHVYEKFVSNDNRPSSLSKTFGSQTFDGALQDFALHFRRIQYYNSEGMKLTFIYKQSLLYKPSYGREHKMRWKYKLHISEISHSNYFSENETKNFL